MASIFETVAARFRMKANGRDVEALVLPNGEIANIPTVEANQLTGMSALSVGSKYPVYIPSEINKALRKWRSALAATISGGADSKLAFIGDSTDQGAWASGAEFAGNRKLCVAQIVAKRLNGIGVPVNVASQFGGTSMSAANLQAYDPRTVLGAGWTTSTAFSAVGNNLLQNTADLTRYDFTPLDVDDQPLVFDRIEVTYLKLPSFANFTVAVDGGAAAFTSTQAGTGALDTVTVSVASGTHTVNIAKTAGDVAKTLLIQGIKCYSSTAKSVHVLNLSAGGFKASDMANTATYYGCLNGIKHFAPNLSVINCTINDSIAATPVATYKANLQAVIDACKLSGDVILRTGNTVQAGYSGWVIDADEPYITAMYELAVANNLLFIDVKSRIGQYVEANIAGFMVEGVHPTRVGYADIATPVFDLVKPQ